MSTPSPLPPTHVERLNSLSKLREEGFKGPDASLHISLDEYGIAWKEIEEDGKPTLLFIHRHPSLRRKYDRTSFALGTDVFKEFNWVEWKNFFAYLGVIQEEFASFPLSQQIYDLVNYYGEENVFGTSYWEGFSIELD